MKRSLRPGLASSASVSRSAASVSLSPILPLIVKRTWQAAQPFSLIREESLPTASTSSEIIRSAVSVSNNLEKRGCAKNVLLSGLFYVYLNLLFDADCRRAVRHTAGRVLKLGLLQHRDVERSCDAKEQAHRRKGGHKDDDA